MAAVPAGIISFVVIFDKIYKKFTTRYELQMLLYVKKDLNDQFEFIYRLFLLLKMDTKKHFFSFFILKTCIVISGNPRTSCIEQGIFKISTNIDVFKLKKYVCILYCTYKFAKIT